MVQSNQDKIGIIDNLVQMLNNDINKLSLQNGHLSAEIANLHNDVTELDSGTVWSSSYM